MKTITERVAEIRKELKAQFPEMKLSVTKGRYKGADITIYEAPSEYNLDPNNSGSFSINHYHMEFYQGKAREIYEAIYAIAAKGVQYYETSDYGTQPNFYINISVGRYDREFKNIYSEVIA